MQKRLHRWHSGLVSTTVVAATLVCLSLVEVVAQSPAALTTPTAVASGGGQPSTWSRQADGHVTVYARRVTQPMNLDGRLDEDVYRTTPPITEFVQQVPTPRAPITEKTEVWILYDDKNIYLACRCWDEHPERIVANEMRRDSSNLTQQDRFDFEFDTFHDKRNGYLFSVTPIGGLRDGLTTDGQAGFDWNGVWDGKGTRFEQGWIAEAAIPFKTLRYQAGREQTWGIQIRRYLRAKNELSYLTEVLPAWGINAINRMSAAATLSGLEVPPPARNLELRPYAITRVTTDLVARPTILNDVEPNAGFDVKYGITKSLTANVTFNTDFAQVEADEAQVNLTRFNLIFPEKREFFLEGQGFFQFGNGAGGNAAGDNSNTPNVFYSRSIGLFTRRSGLTGVREAPREVPIVLGARLNGKSGPWAIGLLNTQTGEDVAAGAPSTNFTVARVRRDVLGKSNIGGIFTRRSASAVVSGANEVFGVDGNFALFENLYFNAFAAKSRTPGLNGRDRAYRGVFNYAADRYGLVVDRLVVDQNFNPEVGVLRRQDFRQNFAQARFSLRTIDNRLVRLLTFQGDLTYITNNENRLESRTQRATVLVELHSSDTMGVEVSRQHEVLTTPFLISAGVRVPAGAYDWENVKLSFSLGQQRRVYGSSTLEVGSFYGGSKKTTTFNGRVGLTRQFSVEPNISLNWIALPVSSGRFTQTVVGSRTTYAMTPRMFVSGLIQYSSGAASLSGNYRFRWEYLPGSELFVVYSEGRSTEAPGVAALQSRGLAVKVSHLLRF